MAVDPFDVMIDLDDLLSRGASSADVTKALALLKKHGRQKMLLSYYAKALVLAGQFAEALKKADAAIADEPSASWPHLWKAAALVGTGAKSSQWAPSLKKAYQGDKDVAGEALAQPVFAAVRTDAAFLSAIGRGASAPKLSADLQRLVKLAQGEPWPLYQATTKLSKHADQASVLDARLYALDAIVDDLDEHGDVNLADAGGKPPAFYRDAQLEAKRARKLLGRKKSAFTLALEET